MADYFAYCNSYISKYDCNVFSPEQVHIIAGEECCRAVHVRKNIVGLIRANNSISKLSFPMAFAGMSAFYMFYQLANFRRDMAEILCTNGIRDFTIECSEQHPINPLSDEIIGSEYDSSIITITWNLNPIT